MGRITGKRGHGKTAFLDVRDITGTIQAYARRDVLGEEAFARVEELDIGDLVGIEGPLHVTKRGQLAIGVRECTLLAKALKDPPDLFHGISDPDMRYRQRELDLMANADSREIFKKRDDLIFAIRTHMHERGWVELETPVLQRLTGGAAARPFVTHHNALDRELFLRTATELYLKRAIVGGFEDVYEFGKFFRNEGMSPQHNPEFTMLEMFVGGADYERRHGVHRDAGRERGREGDGDDGGRARRRRDRLRRALAAGAAARRAAARDRPRHLRGEPRRAGRGGRRGRRQGRRLGRPRRHPAGQAGRAEADPAHLHHRPADRHLAAGQGAPREPEVCEAFDGIVAGMEIVGGGTDINDPIEQRQRFIGQRERQEKGAEYDPHPHDEEFVRALEYGMPPASGCGLGIDRLLMIMTGAKTLRDVIIYPAMRELSE